MLLQEPALGVSLQEIDRKVCQQSEDNTYCNYPIFHSKGLNRLKNLQNNADLLLCFRADNPVF